MLFLYAVVVGLVSGFAVRVKSRAVPPRHRRPLTIRARSLLTAAFEALGPERVRLGLAAHGHCWDDCFITRALRAELGDLTGTAAWKRARWLMSREMGMASSVADEIGWTWDRQEKRFRDLAAEWLESHAEGRAAPGERTLMPS